MREIFFNTFFSIFVAEFDKLASALIAAFFREYILCGA